MSEPLKTLQVDKLPVEVYRDDASAGAAAAADMATFLKAAITQRGGANVILATGNSQLAFLRALRETAGIDWSLVKVFHMDEYIGIDPGHRASFPRFLQQHFFDHVKAATFYPLSGDETRVAVICAEYEQLLRDNPADAVALGWGENGHLAFNDPPYAEFDDPVWVKAIKLDEVSRKQQHGEGHFDSLDEVPTHAITLTIPALLAAGRVLCIVPEARKADAVHACLTQPVSEQRPGSVLRTVDHATLYLDTDSAARIV
ncbi:MAG TPA: 6-phosphogluconolactonase [Trueperaceae bacterium]|nr:6-phosphogluconolactonase [Trueperaceae bacterium]